jgi:hypothetical protein
MKTLDTGRDRQVIDTRPLFSSVWLALYDELRKSQTEKHLAASAVTEKTKTFPGKKSD